MNTLKLVLVFFVVVNSNLFAQKNVLNLIKTIGNNNIQTFTTDINGNIYIIEKNNTISKYDNNGESKLQFNEVKKGKITSLDVSNPLAPLLFLKNTASIIQLDNQLSKKNIFNLYQLGVYNISYIANSNYNYLWMYDDAEMQLKKLDILKKTTNIIPLRQQFDKVLKPIGLINNANNLYIIDKQEGVIKFDQYGSYVTSYHFIAKDIQVLENNIVYRKSDTLYNYNMQLLTEAKIVIPDSATIVKVQYQKGIVFVQRKNTIDIYRIQD